MLHHIEDEFGQRWFVGKGDPAHAAVQQLHSRYFTRIVLPRTLIVGQPTPQAWKKALRQARRLGYNEIEGRRHIRLAECLKVLED